MSDAMAVSVVIPAYNAARFIERTLDTVRAQTCQPRETIVVDDGSVDGTYDVVQAYIGRHAMKGRLLRQENRGQAAARNAGMRIAGGAYIALLDSDDLWYPEKLAAVMSEFDHHPDVDLVCHDENISRDGRVISASRRRKPKGALYDALLFGGNLLSPSATVVRRETALAVGGFDERWEYISVEDYDFWMRFSRVGRIRFLHRVLGEYVLHNHSASRRIVFHYTALEGMLREHFRAYLGVHPGVAGRLRVRRRLSKVYRSAARQLMTYGESSEDQQVFVTRMLRTYPLAPLNVAVALMWAVKSLRPIPEGSAPA